MNLHSKTANKIRCPLSEEKAIKGSACDGCALFETYLEFKHKCMIILKESEQIWIQ